MLGNIIDRLPDDIKDHLVRAQWWRVGPGMRGFERCFVGHVNHDQDMADYAFPWDDEMWTKEGEQAAFRYDKLCRRFGKERIVRLIKQRAGADLDLDAESFVDTESRVDRTVPA